MSEKYSLICYLWIYEPIIYISSHFDYKNKVITHENIETIIIQYLKIYTITANDWVSRSEKI